MTSTAFLKVPFIEILWGGKDAYERKITEPRKYQPSAIPQMRNYAVYVEKEVTYLPVIPCTAPTECGKRDQDRAVASLGKYLAEPQSQRMEPRSYTLLDGFI